jgi:membrane protein
VNTKRAVHAARRLIWGLRAHDAFTAAASSAFWIFLSLVPLLVLVGFFVGQVARTRGVTALVEPVLEMVPGSAEELVGKEIQRMAGANASSVAPLGVAGFLWTASAGLHNLMDVFEAAVRVKRRSWWKQRAIALGWVVAGLATACALAWVLVKTDKAIHPYDPAPAASGAPARSAERATSTTDRAPDRPSDHPADRGPARPVAAAARPRSGIRVRVHKALTTPQEPIVAGLLLLAAGTAFLAGFYRFAVEHPPGVRRVVWPGAAVAVGSWLVVSWAFGAYAVSIADYALYYGSLAAVAILLVWLYLSSLTLVIGAEVNAQLEGRDKPGRVAKQRAWQPSSPPRSP